MQYHSPIQFNLTWGVIDELGSKAATQVKSNKENRSDGFWW